MCDYIIKHYWGEETAKVVVEPNWITTSDNKDLTKEQQNIKELVNNKIFERYNSLTRERLKSETIDNYLISYKYHKKKDPDPKRKRMVTDMTICIKRKVSFIPYVFGIVGIGLFCAIGYLYLLQPKLSNNNETKEIKIDISKKNVIKKEEKVIPKKIVKTLKQKICEKDIIKSLKNDGRCFEQYIFKKCNNNISVSYNIWLKTADIECSVIDNLKKDEDYRSFIKNHKKLKTDLDKFMQKGE